MQKKVLIAGAGASGMCAAIVCARAGALVTVIEKSDYAGEKTVNDRKRQMQSVQ